MYAGEVIKKTNISRDALRHYVDIGLLEPKEDPRNSYKVYKQQDIKAIEFISSASKLGFSLRQIKNLSRRMNEATCKHKSLLPELEGQVQEVRQKIQDLRVIEKHLSQLITDFSEKDCEVEPSELVI